MRHSPKNKPVLKLFLELKRVFIGVINSSNVYVISVPENYVLVHFFKNLINYVSQAPYLLIFLMGSMRYLTSQTSTELFSNSPFPAGSLSVLSYAVYGNESRYPRHGPVIQLGNTDNARRSPHTQRGRNENEGVSVGLSFRLSVRTVPVLVYRCTSFHFRL